MSESTIYAQETISSPSHTSRHHAASALNWVQRWLRSRIISKMGSLAGGTALRVTDPDGTFILGESTSPLVGEITVHDARLYRMMAFQGSLGACEAYLRGYWSTTDLLQTLLVFSRQFDSLVGMDKGSSRFSVLKKRKRHQKKHNSVSGSQRNIAEHYDLSNDFFSLFLDERLMYSSACYDVPDMSLEEASQNKLEKLCRKLQLDSDDHLLEIGTGWGGFALYAAQSRGCKVTTTTISANQLKIAQQRVNEANLGDRITLLKEDYRHLTGQFDKIVSIEMIEAVGQEYLEDYFRKCDSLLKPGGRFVIQAIVIPEQRWDIYRRSVDFIQTYIFPGSFLPSIASMQEAIGNATTFRLVGLEDYTPSYAATLHEWRKRFHQNLDAVKKLGFDERFIRMWDMYLASCEAVFLERAAGLVQLEWIKK